jgi:hypothetical protein
MTILHEFGHFALRFNLKTNLEWLEKVSPKDSDNSSEAGSTLIKAIFKKIPTTINIPASEFLLDIKNWNLKSTTFTKQFKKINTYHPALDLGDGQNKKQRRLKENIGARTHLINLIGCGNTRRNASV